jgi:hypothetical protein
VNETTDLTLAPVADAPQNAGSTFALMMNSDLMDRVMAFSDLMAKGVVTVPKHLRGKPADCMAVCLQAMRWNMDPYAVAQKTHLVNDTLGYEAQLVIAVVQNSGSIVGAFKYEHQGSGQDLMCRVGAVLRGESAITWGPWLRNGDVTVRNSPLWKTNPAQQLGYRQAANWARLYCPGAILGVYTVGELEDAPPMKDMGAAEVVPPASTGAKAMTPEQLDAWREGAKKGRKAARQYWQSLPADVRSTASEATKHAMWKIAEDADAARTVDNGAATTQSTQAPAAPSTASPAPGTEDPWLADMAAAERGANA